ncbi:hypothetical protein MLD52_02790 [Puniceicoccaceae bacterium K14]|nr:hypothetical protein [Puniceicoccaceae bacterium K14]
MSVSDTPLPLAPQDYREKYTGLTFPPKILEMAVAAIKDYEQENPGLGKGISYRAPNSKLEFYIYDLQAAIIPNGTKSEAITKAFESAIADVRSTADSGFYKNFSIETSNEIELGDHSFLHSRFAYSEELIAKESHLLVTGFNTQIVKIRLTLSEKNFSILDLSLTNNPFTSERKQAFQQIAKIFKDSKTLGYTGVSLEQIQSLQENLQKVNTDDGISTNEAITIAQIELINKGYAHTWDIMKPAEAIPSPVAHFQTSFPKRNQQKKQETLQVWISDNGAVTVEQKDFEAQF